MLHADLEPLRTDGLRATLRGADGAPTSFATLLELLAGEARARTDLTRLLVDEGPHAFRLELPPLVPDGLERQAELVLLAADWLDGPADSSAFAEHLSGERSVTVFPNLGGDALLVVPRQAGDASAYTHLGAFLRHGPPAQVDELWRVVARTVLERLRPDAPLWLSTHGGGVPWLHVRLDRRPKYYGHAPYRRAPDG